MEEVPAISQYNTKISDEISEVRRTQIPSLVPSGRVVPFGLFDAEDLQSASQGRAIVNRERVHTLRLTPSQC